MQCLGQESAWRTERVKDPIHNGAFSIEVSVNSGPCSHGAARRAWGDLSPGCCLLDLSFLAEVGANGSLSAQCALQPGRFYGARHSSSLISHIQFASLQGSEWPDTERFKLARTARLLVTPRTWVAPEFNQAGTSFTSGSWQPMRVSSLCSRPRYEQDRC